MGNDKSNTNIISLHDYNDKGTGQSHAVYDVEDVSDFIVDMLDTLMRMAAKKDQSTLVYFLAMARIEAMEMKEPVKT
jgi:hypothetical protein